MAESNLQFKPMYNSGTSKRAEANLPVALINIESLPVVPFLTG